MKQHRPLVVILLALALVVVLLVWDSASRSDRLLYAEVEGYYWDESSQRSVPLVVRVEDPQVLAQVEPWCEDIRRKERARAFRRDMPWLFGNRCENALRQPMERLTLVYEDGRRVEETVNVHITPFRQSWADAQAQN